MMPSKKRKFDRYLVTRARTGDKAALEQLVVRFQRRFLGHAHRLLGDADLAKDAVQEGWVDILRGLHKLRDEDAFSAWGFRIMTRKCARHIDEAQKTKSALHNLKVQAGTAPASGDDIERALGRRLLRKALEQLPEGHGAAIGLFYLEQMSVAEVAVALDIPVGTVKSRLMNARKKLRAVLKGDDDG